MMLDKEVRDDYDFSAMYWDGYDQAIDKSHSGLDVSPKRLSEALSMTLESMRVPESATPAALCPVNFMETRSVSAALNERLQAIGGNLVVKPHDILDLLLGQATNALLRFFGSYDLALAAMPRGFMAFVKRWLNRTVNALVRNVKETMATTIDKLERQLEAVTVD